MDPPSHRTMATFRFFPSLISISTRTVASMNTPWEYAWRVSKAIWTYMVPEEMEDQPLPPFVASDHDFVFRTLATEIRANIAGPPAAEHLALAEAVINTQHDKVLWAGIRSLLIPTLFSGSIVILVTSRAGRFVISWLTGRS